MYPIFPHIFQTDLYFPVIIYAMVITAMGYMALHRYWHSREATDAPRVKQGAEASKVSACGVPHASAPRLPVRSRT